MTGRERVLAALNRESTDRIPLDIGGTDCTSIHALAYKKIREHYGLPVGPVKCGCLTQLIAQIEKDLLDIWEVDTEALFFGSQKAKIWNAPFGVDLVVPEAFPLEDLPDGSSVVTNSEGKITARRAANACYFDPVGLPLAGIKSVEELSRFDALFERWDYPEVFDEPIKDLAARARRLYNATDRAVVGPWNFHYLQSGQFMRGYDQFLIDLMVEKELAHAVLAKLHDVYLKRIDTFLTAFGDSIDIVFLTDDLGTQVSGLISPDLYKEMIFPYARELIGKIKDAGKKVIMHACGAVFDFIPFLIEAGVDALNPVQVSAAHMNPVDLVKEYGKDIAFWGGGADTQSALNAKDPAVVREEVKRRLGEFGDDASLIFTQVHNIQYDVPSQNIAAMVETFQSECR